MHTQPHRNLQCFCFSFATGPFADDDGAVRKFPERSFEGLRKRTRCKSPIMLLAAEEAGATAIASFAAEGEASADSASSAAGACFFLPSFDLPPTDLAFELRPTILPGIAPTRAAHCGGPRTGRSTRARRTGARG